MKNLLTLLVITVVTASCTTNDAPYIPLEPTDPNANIVNVSGAISSDATWTSDNIYVLNQKVVVTNGATLTIQAGTIIKGKPGQGSLASALIIARDGKINAVGTPTQPIIFTSESDNIAIGQTAGTNLTVNNRGLWGGLIILGNAPGSFSNDVSELQIEGLPADDTFGRYGGTNSADNSGTIKYVSIRHGGALIGEGNEINGLTLGCVGSGTTIDHVEVIGNVDDGIEFFGGSVNVTNAIIWGVGDDGLDIDQAYAGTISNALVILGDVSDHALEIDGPEGSLTGLFTLENVTLVGNLTTPDGEYADYRSNAMGTTKNVYAFGFKSSSDIELDNDGVANNYNNGLLVFDNFQIAVPDGTTISNIFANKAATVSTPTFGTEGSSVVIGSQTTGANLSLLSWSYTSMTSGFQF